METIKSREHRSRLFVIQSTLEADFAAAMSDKPRDGTGDRRNQQRDSHVLLGHQMQDEQGHEKHDDADRRTH